MLSLVREATHEWIGVGMFVILIVHHILNRKWTRHIGKGKYTPVRIMQTILVCLLIISILGSMLSGIILSRHVFYFINIRGISVLAGRVHMTCAYWGFVLMSLHLGIHWRMIMAATGKQSSRLDSGKPQHIRSFSFRYILFSLITQNLSSSIMLPELRPILSLINDPLEKEVFY